MTSVEKTAKMQDGGSDIPKVNKNVKMQESTNHGGPKKPKFFNRKTESERWAVLRRLPTVM